MKVLALVSDAHGGFGGISQFNRDALEAMATFPDVEAIDVVPRMLLSEPGALPGRITYQTPAAAGKLAFMREVARQSLSSKGYGLILCAHINLLPAAVMAAGMTRAPVVLTIHGIDAWEPPGWLTRHQVKLGISAVISVSAHTRERFLSWCPFPRDHVHIVPNTVHLERYGAAPASAELMKRYDLTGRKVLMTFGRMVGKERAKGFDEIIELLPSLKSEMPDIAYMAVGDGPDRLRLQARANALGVGDCVVFTGMIDDEEKADILRLADLFVMPSRGEGFGIVILEALACGIPVVASRRDGTREAVLDGKLGLLVDPDDPQDIVRGIKKGLKLARGVHAGLDHFNYQNFSARLQHALSSTIAR